MSPLLSDREPVSPADVPSVVLRLATIAEDQALRRLSELDSRPLPRGQLLIAEVDGELRAAYSSLENIAIADPFKPSAHLIEMLGAHARHRDHAARSSRRTFARLTGRAPWPA